MNVAGNSEAERWGASSPPRLDKSLLDIAKLLEHHGIGCVVVEADDGKVAGIVSERDLVRRSAKAAPRS